MAVGRVAVAVARSAVINSAVPRGARRSRRSAVAPRAVLAVGRVAAAVARSAGVQLRGAARSAAPPAAGGGAENRVGRVAAAVARSAGVQFRGGARSAARPAVGGGAEGRVGRRPRSGGGGAKRGDQFRGARARSAALPAAGGGTEDSVGRVAAAEARSAVFNSVVPARSAAPLGWRSVVAPSPKDTVVCVGRVL